MGFADWLGVFRLVVEELAGGRTKREREPDHGCCGRCRPSCRRMPCRCFASEVKLAEAALDRLFISTMPEKFVGGKAYDSGKPYAELLKKHRVELIAPHRRNRTKSGTQDGS